MQFRLFPTFPVRANFNFGTDFRGLICLRCLLVVLSTVGDGLAVDEFQDSRMHSRVLVTRIAAWSVRVCGQGGAGRGSNEVCLRSAR